MQIHFVPSVDFMRSEKSLSPKSTCALPFAGSSTGNGLLEGGT
jgi:hypothetical protein